MNTQRILPPITVSLDTINQNSLQEILTFISCHLLTQGKQARNSTGSCKYKLESNTEILKCAVGCIIPDSLYTERFEGMKVKTLLDELHIILNNDDKLCLLSDLQALHDRAESDNIYIAWYHRLVTLAKSYKLQIEWDTQGNYISRQSV